MSRWTAVSLVCVLLSCSGVGMASVLTDTPRHYPCIYSTGESISYNAATGQLDVIAYPSTYNRTNNMAEANTMDPFQGYLEIHAVIDPAARTISSLESNMYLNGAVQIGEDSFGPVYGPLAMYFQSARAAEFDYDWSNNGQLSFRFWQDDGEAAPANSNVVVHVWSGASSFDNLDSTFIFDADTFFLPEPGTLALLIAGAFALAWRRARTRRFV
jgi:hypothetical protein